MVDGSRYVSDALVAKAKAAAFAGGKASMRAGLEAVAGDIAREVIARALLDLAGARAVLPTAQQADAVLAALSSAGLAVVPAGEQREEWGTRRPDGSVLALGQTREWEEEAVAYENSRPDGVRGCVVVSRAVYCGPWRPVSPEPEGTGP